MRRGRNGNGTRTPAPNRQDVSDLQSMPAPHPRRRTPPPASSPTAFAARPHSDSQSALPAPPACAPACPALRLPAPNARSRTPPPLPLQPPRLPAAARHAKPASRHRRNPSGAGAAPGTTLPARHELRQRPRTTAVPRHSRSAGKARGPHARGRTRTPPAPENAALIRRRRGPRATRSRSRHRLFLRRRAQHSSGAGRAQGSTLPQQAQTPPAPKEYPPPPAPQRPPGRAPTPPPAAGAASSLLARSAFACCQRPALRLRQGACEASPAPGGSRATRSRERLRGRAAQGKARGSSGAARAPHSTLQQQAQTSPAPGGSRATRSRERLRGRAAQGKARAHPAPRGASGHAPGTEPFAAGAAPRSTLQHEAQTPPAPGKARAHPAPEEAHGAPKPHAHSRRRSLPIANRRAGAEVS